MSTISTHVLDTARGRPAAGLRVTLRARDGDGWRDVGAADTNADGRAPDLLVDDATLPAGTYQLHFATGAWLAAEGVDGFYPEAAVVFEIAGDDHYHVPLLLSPYGYATYRGS